MYCGLQKRFVHMCTCKQSFCQCHISRSSIKTSQFPEFIPANPFNRHCDFQKRFLISVSSTVVRDKGQTRLHCRLNRRRGPEVEQPLKDWARQRRVLLLFNNRVGAVFNDFSVSDLFNFLINGHKLRSLTYWFCQHVCDGLKLPQMDES